MLTKLVLAVISSMPLALAACFANELKDKRIRNIASVFAECIFVYFCLMFMADKGVILYYLACIVEMGNIVFVSSVFCKGNPWKSGTVILIVELISNIMLFASMLVSPAVGNMIKAVMAGERFSAENIIITFLMVLASSVISVLIVRLFSRKLPDPGFDIYKILYLVYTAVSSVSVITKRQYFVKNKAVTAISAVVLVFIIIFSVDLIVMFTALLSRRIMYTNRKRIEKSVKEASEYFDRSMKNMDIKDLVLSGNVNIDSVLADMQEKFQKKDKILDGFVRINNAEREDYEKVLLTADALRQALQFSLEFVKSYTIYRVMEKEQSFFVRVEFDFLSDDPKIKKSSVKSAENLARHIRKYGGQADANVSGDEYTINIMLM